MKNYRDKKKDVKKLTDLRMELYADFGKVISGTTGEPEDPEPGTFFRSFYQQWYTEAREIISRSLPSRLGEFEFLYLGEPKRKNRKDRARAIRDWLLGTGMSRGRNSFSVFRRFRLQCQIMQSVNLSFKSTLFAIAPAIIDSGDVTTDPAYERNYLWYARFLYSNSVLFKNMMYKGPGADRIGEILEEGFEKRGMPIRKGQNE